MPHHVVTSPPTEGRLIHWAARYDLLTWLLTFGRIARLRALIADRADVQPGDMILDVACGTGDLALVLGRRMGSTGRVVGIDASPEMITRARRKAQRQGVAVDFHVEPVEALSFPDGTFDRVASSLAFHHFPGDLKRRAVESIARVLKPGGRLLIVDLDPAARHIPLHRTMPPPTPDHLVPDLLRAAGFTDVTEEPLRFTSLGARLGLSLPLTSIMARRPPALMKFDNQEGVS